MTRRAAVVTVVVAALLAGVVAWVLVARGGSPSDPATPSPTPEPTPSATPTPTPAPTPTPTPDETEPPAPDPEPTGAGPDGPAPAPTTVTVTYGYFDAAAGEVVVGGYADVVESGGTCTLVLTQDARVVTTSVQATPDAASTSCGALSVRRGDLGPGTWSAELQYSSPTAAGSAAPVSIEVS